MQRMLATSKLNQPTIGKDNWEGREVCGEVTLKRSAQERMGEVARSGIHAFVRI